MTEGGGYSGYSILGVGRAGKWSQSRNKNREGKHQMIQMHKKLPDDCWRAKTPSHSKKLLGNSPHRLLNFWVHGPCLSQ